MNQIHNIRYYLALFTAVFIWSSAFIVTKIALDGFGPFTLSILRIMVAFLVLLPFAWKRGFRFQNIFSRNSIIYGITGYGGNLVLLSLGLITCSANISAIIHGLFPVFMIGFGYFLLKESITKYKIISIILSVIGVFIASVGDLTSNSNTTIVGILLVVVSVFTWAFYSVFTKKTAEGMDSFVLTEICFGASLLCILPFVILESIRYGIMVPDVATVFSIIYLGCMSGAVGILLWNFGIKKVDSTVAGIYFNLLPVIGLFFAFFAGENITFLQILGCGLVLVGVLVGMKKLNVK